MTVFVEASSRTGTGRVTSLVIFMAAAVAWVNTLGGSITALLPVQTVAMMFDCGCSPVSLQLEGEILNFIIAPVQLKWAGLSYDMSILVNLIAIVVVVAALEGAVYVAISIRQSTKAPDEMTSQAGDADTLESNETHPEPNAWPYAKAPYMTLAFAMALSTGIVRHAFRVVMTETQRWVQLCSVSALIVCVCGVPFGVLCIARQKEWSFVAYQASKGNIPRWLQPSGVWGTNQQRQQYGVILEDFSQGHKMFAIAVVLFRSFVSLLFGAIPETAEGCRAVLWMHIFDEIALAAALHVATPLRSKFHNRFTFVGCVLILLTAIVHVVTSGYYYDDDRFWGADAMLLLGFIIGIQQTISMLGTVFVLFWEVHGRHAYQHIRTNSAVARKKAARTVDAVAEEMLHEMEVLFEPNDDDLEIAAPTPGAASELDSPSGRAREGRRMARNQLNATDPEEGKPMLLADFLLQDVEMLPASTRREIYMARYFEQLRGRESRRLVEPMIVHPSLCPSFKHNNKNYIQPRSKPLDLHSFDSRKESVCFGNGQDEPLT